MDVKYLMDTDICIHIIRSKDNSILRKVCAEELGQISLSAITVAELEVGAAKSSQSEKAYIALNEFLSPMTIRSFDQKAAHVYGSLRAQLEHAGKKIGAMDMLIAAQALAEGLVLITNNYREFGRVEGLSTESWYEINLN